MTTPTNKAFCETSPPPPVDRRTDRARATAAFRAVRKLGVTTRFGQQCCGSCLSADLHAKGVTSAIYFSRQGLDAFQTAGRYGRGDEGMLRPGRSLWISWSLTPELLTKVCAAFEAEGLVVVAPPDTSRCIEVKSIEPERRPAPAKE